LVVVLLAGLSLGLLAQRRGFPGGFGGEPPGPPSADANERTEWVFGRLNLGGPSFGGDIFGFRGRGFHRWAADYPKSDRQLVQGVRRLTRLHARSEPQIVDLDSDDVFNWPWLFAEDIGTAVATGWPTEAQAQRLREYLLRGGFMMADDTHGDQEWENLVAAMRMVFPERPIEDLDNSDQIFHVVYDLDERFQIHGTRYLGRTYRSDETPDRWRGIRDDKGRIMVAICHNSDVGDAWEWADWSGYPEREASLAYRIAINYIIYAMTH
jgi:hypothetical protein